MNARRTHHTWTPRHDEVLAKGIAEGLSYAEIGERVGRSGASVAFRIRVLKQRADRAISVLVVMDEENDDE